MAHEVISEATRRARRVLNGLVVAVLIFNISSVSLDNKLSLSPLGLDVSLTQSNVRLIFLVALVYFFFIFSTYWLYDFVYFRQSAYTEMKTDYHKERGRIKEETVSSIESLICTLANQEYYSQIRRDADNVFHFVTNNIETFGLERVQEWLEKQRRNNPALNHEGAEESASFIYTLGTYARQGVKDGARDINKPELWLRFNEIFSSATRETTRIRKHFWIVYIWRIVIFGLVEGALPFATFGIGLLAALGILDVEVAPS
jgi:hypothetical protein